MTKVLTDSTVYPAIAVAIRGKNGLADTYTPSEMAGAITALNPDSSTFAHKFVGANGEYSAADDNVDGYSSVEVFVPNSYAEEDEGCVVDDGVLVQQTALTVRASGTYDTTLIDSVTVDIGGSVLGTKSITANGDYSAEYDSLDGYSSVSVDVPNSYAASDEGKVVSSGALVSQTSLSVTENGTYDTTTKDEVVVNVAGGASWRDSFSVNWDFSNPVNTRGSQTYDSAILIYTLDGWQLQGGSLAIVNGGITLARYSSNIAGYFMQRYLQTITSTMVGKQFTLSLLVDDDLQSSTFTMPSANAGTEGVMSGGVAFRVWNYGTEVAVTIDISESMGTEIIRAVKLEAGTSQTLATLENGVYTLNNSMDVATEYIKARSGIVRNS